ncbi:hypothetical protein MHBO_001287 [Bonamia ostreae]|uniref:ADF-H domain-containing protein n=1 Tax=Bonamia ostreae TaxID=126728 RepID=A0ABV2AIF5_9EUKA
MTTSFSDNCHSAYSEFKTKDIKTNYLVFSVEKNGSNHKIDVSRKGEDGLTGLKDLLSSEYDDKVAFAVIRVNGVDNKNELVSTRNKFIFICFVGSKTPVRVRGAASFLSPQVQNFLGSFVQYTSFL